MAANPRELAQASGLITPASNNVTPQAGNSHNETTPPAPALNSARNNDLDKVIQQIKELHEQRFFGEFYVRFYNGSPSLMEITKQTKFFGNDNPKYGGNKSDDYNRK